MTKSNSKKRKQKGKKEKRNSSAGDDRGRKHFGDGFICYHTSKTNLQVDAEAAQ